MTHGTASTYRHGCRCEPCQIAMRRSWKLERYRRATGQTRLVPYAVISAHLDRLQSAGMSLAQIATAAGMTKTRLGTIRQRASYVRPATAAQLLSVQPSTPPRPDDLVPGIGTRRRLQALAAIGWDQRRLGRRLGVNGNVVHVLTHGDGHQVRQRTHDQVTALYERLHMTPGPSIRARNNAQRHGWPPPLAWHERDLDDPTHRPRGQRRAA